MKICMEGRVVFLLVTVINQPSPAFEELVHTDEHGWELIVNRWTHDSTSVVVEETPISTLLALSDVLNTVHAMKELCALLLIMQALTLLQLAKGYARLGIVTQTLA